MSERTCTACSKPYYSKGYCRTHYERVKKTGTTELVNKTPEDRFWVKVDKSEKCWTWTGSTTPKGYGQIHVGSKANRSLVAAHRFSYEIHKGSIPSGMYVDHICRVRSCVNPDHLRLVTPKQNQENRSGIGRGTSGVRGVVKNANGPSWRAGVRHNWTHYNLGSFPTIEEAEAAVIAKRNELYTHNDADRMDTRRETRREP